MTTLPDCKHCGLPTPMCSCSTPDAVYYEVELPRNDIKIEREVSPAEGLSDYDKSTLFTEAYLYGHRKHGYLAGY